MSERKDDPPLFGGIQIEKQKSPFLGGPVILKDLGSRKRKKRPT